MLVLIGKVYALGALRGLFADEGDDLFLEVGFTFIRVDASLRRRITR